MSMHNSNTKLIEITIVSVALEINAVDTWGDAGSVFIAILSLEQ